MGQFVNSQPTCPRQTARSLAGVDAHPISNGADLAAKVGSMAPGTTVQISIFRDGGERTIPVTLGELPVTPFKPAAAPQEQEPSRLGLTLAPRPRSREQATKE